MTRPLFWLVAIAALVIAASWWLVRQRDHPAARSQILLPPITDADSTETVSRHTPDSRGAPITPRQYTEEQDVTDSASSKSSTRPDSVPLARIIFGRLVGDDGTPFLRPVSAIERASWRGKSSSHATDLSTDAQGRFRLSIDEPFDPREEGSKRDVLFIAYPLRGAPTPDFREARGVRVDLSRDLPSDETDLGDITMALAPVIAAGTVVDPSGQAVEGAQVSPRTEDLGTTPTEVSSERARLRQLVVESDATGSFEVRGFLEASTLSVRAWKFGWKESASPPLPLGARGVRLVLNRDGALEGRVLLDAGVPARLVSVEVSITSRNLGAFSNEVRLDPDGSFRWRVKQADTLKVTVGAVGAAGLLAEVPGIAVRPGEVTRDPRLDPLDLRGKLRLIKVTVVDGEGRPVPEAVVFVEPSAAVRCEYGVLTDKGGAAPLLTTNTAVDLRVEADGFRIARVQGVAGDTRVVLGLGPRIVFRFEGELPPLPPGIVARVKLVHVLEGGPEVETDHSPFHRRVIGRDGIQKTQQAEGRHLMRPQVECVLAANWTSGEVGMPEPGRFEASLMLERRTEGGGGIGFGVDFPTPPRVLVEDRAGTQSVSCEKPPAESLAKTLEMLKK